MSRMAEALLEAWEFFHGNDDLDFMDNNDWDKAHFYLKAYLDYPDTLKAMSKRTLNDVAKRGRTQAIRAAAAVEQDNRRAAAIA